MTARLAGAVGLLVVGAVLRVPVAAVLGIFATTLELVHVVWANRGLESVSYVRRLETHRLDFGADMAMTVEVWNRQPLPLAWLDAREEASPGVVVTGGAVLTPDSPFGMRNTWSLAPYERVVRHLRLTATERGVFAIGPVALSVGDVFARRAASAELPSIDRFLVRPRTVPTRWAAVARQAGDVERSRTGLFEDPARFGGVRAYQAGDPLRRIHARASARLGQPVVKRFEPSRRREVLVVVDVQTNDGPAWQISFDPEVVEELFVVAASITRSLAARGAAFGVAASGYTGAEARLATLPVAADAGQADRALDLLARLSSHPSAPFDVLLRHVRRVAAPGTTVVVVTTRDPTPHARALRALERAGFTIEVVASGRDGEAHAAAARRRGFSARTAGLDGPWRTATSLVVGR